MARHTKSPLQGHYIGVHECIHANEEFQSAPDFNFSGIHSNGISNLREISRNIIQFAGKFPCSLPRSQLFILILPGIMADAARTQVTLDQMSNWKGASRQEDLVP